MSNPVKQVYSQPTGFLWMLLIVQLFLVAGAGGIPTLIALCGLCQIVVCIYRGLCQILGCIYHGLRGIV